MRMQLCFDAQDGEQNLNSAIALTGMAAVNAIPWVVDAEPGIHHAIAGPDVVTRQASAHAPRAEG
jgi:hypothetical protein